MKGCSYRKRLPLYLDGWIGADEASRLEEHLKNCPSCQTELMELEEISSSALEMIDQAPDHDYWKTFSSRVLNRINSRGIIAPAAEEKVSKKGVSPFRYSVFMIAGLAAVLAIFYNYMPDSSGPLPSQNGFSGEMSVDKVETSADFSEISDPGSPVESGVISRGSKAAPEVVSTEAAINSAELSESSNPLSSDLTLSESADEPRVDFSSYFRDDFIRRDARLTFHTFYDFLIGSSSDGPGNESRLSVEALAAGILSESNRSGIGAMESYPGGSAYSVPLSGGGLTVNWGYLSMPSDTAKTGEFQRYLIELRLMQAK